MTKKSYSRKDAAEYMSLSIRTIDKLAASGELPKIKVGRKTLFRVDDLDAYLDRNIIRPSCVEEN